MRRDRGEYRDPAIAAGVGQFAVIQSVAPSVGVDVSPVNITDTAEIERAVATFAHSAKWRAYLDGKRAVGGPS